MEKRILIVEDDVAFGTMLNTWFSKNSWDANWVSKIELAKQELQNNTYNLVLSDLRLPDGDGIIFLTWMRENNIMTPFIIMTSYSDVQTAVSAMKLGAFDYLQKPINPTILQQKIEMALSQPVVEAKNETEKNLRKYNNLLIRWLKAAALSCNVFIHTSIWWLQQRCRFLFLAKAVQERNISLA